MSEHTWVQENLAAFVAGGLEPAEVERLRQHVASCAECESDLRQSGALDQQLSALMTDAVPGPTLEDRLVHKLWTGIRKKRFFPRLPRLAWGAAAAGLLVACGAGLGFFLDPDHLPFPGTSGSGRAVVFNNLKEVRGTLLGFDYYDDRGTPNASMGKILREDRSEHKLMDGFMLKPTYGNGKEFRGPNQMAGEVAKYHLESVNGTANTVLGSPQDNFTHLWGHGGDLSRRYKGSAAVLDNTDSMAKAVKEKTPTETAMGSGGGAWGYGSMNSPSGMGPPSGGAGRRIETKPDQSKLGVGKAESGEGAGNQSLSGSGLGMGDSLSLGQRTGYRFDPAKHFQEQAGKGVKTYNAPATALGVIVPAETQVAPAQAGTPFAPASASSTSAGEGEGKKPAPKPEEPAPVPSRKIIRSGDIEFEVEAFDAAVATVTRLVTTIKGGYVATVNSDKLPNGKMRGSLVVRVPPEFLDALVLDLRKELGKTGELKSQRIGSQDITKQYTDLESRLKAARTMEERLLQIIKTGKGEIKDLVGAEKELGVWRTKIEEMEGELRYYTHQVALSTLTIQLTEKEIRAAAVVLETEKVQMGLEVEDVDKAFREAREAVDAAKGRVTRSEVKQHAAGQFSAVLEFEVAPEAAGPLRDRLKQIGSLARLDINRVQKAEPGSEAVRTAPVRRGDTQFNLHIYNLTTVTPRETAVIQLAVPDVPAGFQALREAAAKARGRIINAQLNEQDRQSVNAQLDFEVRRAHEASIQEALARAGEIVSRTVARAPEGESVTDTKVRLQLTVKSAASIDPRETIQLALEVNDVDNTLAVFGALVNEVKGRSLQPQVTHERSGRVTARLVYDVPLPAAPALVEKFKTAGTVRLETFARNEKVPEGKLALARLEVTLANTELLIPKDQGLWSHIRTGLSTSLKFLSMSVSWLIFGLCVVLPWVLVALGGLWLVRRWWRRPVTPPTTPNP